MEVPLFYKERKPTLKSNGERRRRTTPAAVTKKRKSSKRHEKLGNEQKDRQTQVHQGNVFVAASEIGLFWRYRMNNRHKRRNSMTMAPSETTALGSIFEQRRKEFAACRSRARTIHTCCCVFVRKNISYMSKFQVSAVVVMATSMLPTSWETIYTRSHHSSAFAANG